MNRLAAVCMLLTLVLAGSASAGSLPRALVPAAPAPADSRDGWPDTPAGAIARRWVAAFSAGEAAMRAFNVNELAADPRSRRSPEERIARYRTLHDSLGRLALGEILESDANRLKVRLMAEDATLHEFTFTVQKEQPHKLVSVTMLAQSHGIHGMFGGFHH